MSGGYSEALFEHLASSAPADSKFSSTVPPEKGHSANAAAPVEEEEEQKPVQAPPVVVSAYVINRASVLAEAEIKKLEVTLPLASAARRVKS